MLKITTEEKEFLERISAVSGHDIDIVRDIFLSLWISVTIELYQGKKDYNILFLFKVYFDYQQNFVRKGEKPKVFNKVIPNPAFSKTLLQVAKGETANLQALLKDELKSLINEIIDY